MMRIALIGLSTPFAYYYNGEMMDWNGADWTPLLEGAVGLATLYDQLWFLHRQLCPFSMRSEPYVRFLTEDKDISAQVAKIAVRLRDDRELKDLSRIIGIGDLDRSGADYWSVVRERVGPWRERGLNADNHSHPMQIGAHNMVIGDAWSPYSIATDLLLYAYLRNTTGLSIELISNIYVDMRMSPRISTAIENRVATELLVRRISSVFGPAGPDIEGVQALRDIRYLRDFRDLIADYSENADDRLVPSLVRQIESEFQNYTTKVVLKKHKDALVSRSVARVVLSNLIDWLIPGLGVAIKLDEDSQTRRANWAAFLAEASTISQQNTRV